ncbi:MAG: hypothetical protein QMD86_01995 [Patescibacteria group bacterium]|nr:hypothetical protein [Patescibacteria group bacterium]
MAITFEEEKKKINWSAVVVIGFIVAAIGTAVYYLFFITPPLVETIISPKLKTISEISKLNFDFQGALNNLSSKNLKNIVEFNPAPQESIGKNNPFFP